MSSPTAVPSAGDAGPPMASDTRMPNGTPSNTSRARARSSEVRRSDLSSRVRFVEAALVAALALGTRLVYLDHVPHKDELNHVLAARSLLGAGTLEIIPGAEPYDRAWVFTYMTAGMFRLFGESLVVARIPAVLAGVALVLALFLWVRAEAGRVGAWLAALLLIFSPISLQLSQWVRFYTIHALLLFLACLLAYRLFTTPAQRSWMIAARASALVLCLLLAFHFQKTTVVAAGGLLFWVSLMSLPPLLRRFSKPRERAWLVAGAIGIAVLAVALAVLSGMAEWAIGYATYADLWAEENRHNLRYYHWLLLDQYPTLWTLFPLAVLLAAAARRRAALLCACVFGVAFLVHSFMAWKDERYLFYAIPMFFAAWGIAVGGSLPWLWNRLRTLLDRSSDRALSPRVLSWGVGALLAAVVLFASAGNGAASYSFRMLTAGDVDWWWRWGSYRGNPDWVASSRALGPLVQEADAVLASYDVTAIYGLGRLDYLLRRVRTPAGEMAEFGLYRKTSVPVISTPESLATVMGCHASGLVIIERFQWRNDWGVTPATADYLEAHTQAIPLPRELRLHAYYWDGRGEQAGTEFCSPLLRPNR